MPHGDMHGHTDKGPILQMDNFAQWQPNILATYQLAKVSCIHVGSTGYFVA